MNVAEKMRKIYAGKQPWSPEYKQFSKAISFWKRMIKHKKSVNTSYTALKRLSKYVELPWTIVRLSTLEECKSKLKDAYKAYHKNKREYKKLRNAHNQSLIDALAEEIALTKKDIEKKG